jgi:hypothetical protein
VTRQLETSVAARWRERTAGPDGRLRHRQTRAGYDRAVVDAVRHSSPPLAAARGLSMLRCTGMVPS